MIEMINISLWAFGGFLWGINFVLFLMWYLGKKEAKG
jgi:hypothetical protein